MGKSKPSTRAGQFERASRSRATRKRREKFGYGAKWIVFGSLGGITLIAFIWVFMSGTATMWKNQTVNAFYNQTKEVGFKLTNVYLSGHDKLSKQAILHHSDLVFGQPILQVSLPELREKLESLPQIRHVVINRQLPRDLHIIISERYAAALWQDKDQLFVVDDEGVLMGDGDPVKHNHLPLLVGSQAPENFLSLMELLKSAPKVKESFDSAVYVGQRRWNIWLANGIEIKLPEVNPENALVQLEALQKSQPLAGTDISSIDLRVPERMFIRPKIKLVQQASQQL